MNGSILILIPGDDGPSTVLMKFDTGKGVLIPFDQLKLLPGSNYYLLLEANIEQWKTGSIRAHSDQIVQDLVIPVIKGEIKIGKRVHHEKVQVSKQVHEEGVEIKRIKMKCWTLRYLSIQRGTQG